MENCGQLVDMVLSAAVMATVIMPCHNSECGNEGCLSRTTVTQLLSLSVLRNANMRDTVEYPLIFQEVVLRKKQPREIFGLTLSYSALSASDNSESEVYISAVSRIRWK